ncbi:Centromere protein Scm3 [Metschnikowia aff. pulcherrima]|uniref:Centromere protein Scm3 n=1 Tax=Metschnikowia aff. pulcherrima TaxID=2163413 RepID=A0A4P6XKF4_9ASCO|nr:Centromere protein Scm3 [Metschnikowia aff. pulcherrima]
MSHCSLEVNRHSHVICQNQIRSILGSPKQQTAMASVTSEFDNLILIDESSEYDSSHENIGHIESWPQEKSLDSEVFRLKALNTNRLQQKWDEIIAKYSSIDDSKESDEIDLRTGKIIVDNGHLRSFADAAASQNGTRAYSSVWAPDDQIEKELRRARHAENIRKKLRQEEKQRLKANESFYNTRMKLMKLRSEVLEDNLMLLSPSPTKKHRVSTMSPSSLSLSSPSKFEPFSLGHGHRLDTPESSPLKQKLPSIVSSPSGSLAGSPTKQSPNKSDELLSPEKAFHTNHRDSSQSVDSYDYRPNDDSTAKDDPGVSSETSHEEYNELFLIAEIYDPWHISYFRCAFYGCKYTNSSKASYRAHLLSSHSPELKQIGYPVHTEKLCVDLIPGDTIPKLNIHFPLTINIPQRPFRCLLQLNHGTCQKIFTDEKQLARHRLDPGSCSLKRQVFVCPLLGCDFMTDTGYREFYDHAKSHRKHFTTLSDKKCSENIIGETGCHNESFLDFTASDQDTVNNCCDSINLVKQRLPSQQQKSSQKTVKNKYVRDVSDSVPRLDIADHGIDFDIDTGSHAEDNGYSSIDELFQ